MFASATGRSPVVLAAAESYMREYPLFVGGDGEAGRAQGLPDNIRHTIVTMPKVRFRTPPNGMLNVEC